MVEQSVRGRRESCSYRLQSGKGEQKRRCTLPKASLSCTPSRHSRERADIKVLKLKLVLVSTLIVVAVIAIPIISWPGNTFKFVKHALEWDYFLGVITFYLLTYFMWKNKN